MNFGQIRRFARHVNADHARKFTEHMVPHVVRPAQVIWNKVIGLIFLVFAFGALSRAYHAYQVLHTDPNGSFQFFVSLLFAIPMLAFGIASFWRARRLSRK